MVLCENACSKASLVTGIALDEDRFIFRDILEMMRKFPDINMV